MPTKTIKPFTGKLSSKKMPREVPPVDDMDKVPDGSEDESIPDKTSEFQSMVDEMTPEEAQMMCDMCDKKLSVGAKLEGNWPDGDGGMKSSELE